MTNSPAAIKSLVTYVICTLMAIVVGYLLTSQMDYGTAGVFGLIALLLLSPLIIKWHYPLMLFSFACPVYCFFLPGKPPLWQVVVMMSFCIAIIERTLNSDKRFISPPVMVWPMLFTAAVVYLTAKLTGGIGLRALGGGEGGGVGGGKKYIEVFLGIITFFALTSRSIPPERRKLYIFLYFFSSFPSFIGDLFPLLPSPLNYINYLIPPTQAFTDGGFSLTSRLAGFGTTASVISGYFLAKYGLRGIFLSHRPFRMLLYLTGLVFSLSGGFRSTFISTGAILLALFLLEGLHRTRLIMVLFLATIIGGCFVVEFSRHLPSSVQRSLTVFPLDLDPMIRADAEGSSQWRYEMWHDLWPKVPQYLLLGKGYALTSDDYELMGGGQFANGADAAMDKSNIALAVAGDYHNGPLSTLIPFGIWGGVAMLWLFGASVFVTYRNYKYSGPEWQAMNRYLFVFTAWGVVGFLFIFGAFSDNIYGIARVVGLSIALNAGVLAPKPRVRYSAPIAATARRAQGPQPLPA